jgi:hypothetical protein
MSITFVLGRLWAGARSRGVRDGVRRWEKLTVVDLRAPRVAAFFTSVLATIDAVRHHGRGPDDSGGAGHRCGPDD